MPGFAEPPRSRVPSLGGVRPRVFVCLLAGLLGLTGGWPGWLNWPEDAPPNGARGNYFTMVSVEGTKFAVACQGSGPSTVVVVGHSVRSLAVDDAVWRQLAQSVRLCTVVMAEATARPMPNLTTHLPVTLNSLQLPAPYVFVCAASLLPAFSQPPGPPTDLVAGFVLIGSSAHPSPGLVLHLDGRWWPLPEDDRNRTVLAILSLFWPPDEA